MRVKTEQSIAVHVVAAFVVIIASLFAFVLSQFVYAAGETLSSPSDKTIYEGQHITIGDLQVNGSGNDQLTMILNASNGSLQFGNSEGLTFDGPDFGSTVQFGGTRSDINAALSTLRYSADNPGEHTIEATLGDGNYWAENGHVYMVVADPGTSWHDAKAAAEATTYGGVNGYLATITNQEEHDFILERISDSGWIGATDVDEESAWGEGEWRWATGPETDTQFWTGDEEGSSFEGAFANWNLGEPNNAGDSEDCGQIWFSDDSEGQWNDLNCESEENEYYVVEFGGDGEDLPAVEQTDFQITVEAAPEIDFTSLLPADNSVVTSVTALSITYNQQMEMGEGYITVYNATDDSEVAQIGTYDGSTEDGLTFVYELPEALASNASYYVHISEWGMIGLIDHYDGFEDETTWSFTVVDAAAPNGGDANDDGTVDSLQPSVSSYTNSYTGKYVAIDVGEECELATDDVTREINFDVQDAAYEYDNGLWKFETDCGTPGFTTTVKLYYYDISAENMVVRKHNPETGAYFTLTDAIIETTTIGGQNVVVVTYQITDGSERDVDATENGYIIDPVGLAQNVVGTPNTGLGESRN